MKKKIISLCALFILIICFGFKNVFAQTEIGNYGVNLDLALDYNHPKDVRDTEYKITDSGRFNQGYDSIRVNDLYGGLYDLDNLYRDGYRTLVGEIELEMKEIDKGYQYIFIYDDTTKNTWLTGCKYSLGDGTKVTSYKKVTFYFELNLANITNNNFVIRYGASGDYDDDWMNRNLKIFVGFSKNVQKTQNMWELTWNNDEHTSYTFSQLTLSN